MGKRIVATFLWFLCGWVVGDLFAYLLGLHEVLAPIIGTAAAALTAVDPLAVIWTKQAAGVPNVPAAAATADR
jgi:hypothetical protein